MAYVKGVLFPNYKFFMTDASSPSLGLTGLSPSVEVSDDAGTFAASVGSATQLQSGWYVLSSVDSSEMDNDSIGLQATAAGANDWRDVIVPEDFSRTDIKSDTLAIFASLPARFANLDISSGTGHVSVKSMFTPADMTITAMSSLNSLIFTGANSFHEGSTERNLARAVGFLVNFVDFSGDTMQVKKSDDSTNFWTATTSGDSAAKPIVAKDPS